MAETIRFAVEREEKIQEESLLKDKDFVVDLVRACYFSEHFFVLSKLVFSSPSPSPPPPPPPHPSSRHSAKVQAEMVIC